MFSQLTQRIILAFLRMAGLFNASGNNYVIHPKFIRVGKGTTNAQGAVNVSFGSPAFDRVPAVIVTPIYSSHTPISLNLDVIAANSFGVYSHVPGAAAGTGTGIATSFQWVAIDPLYIISGG